MVSGYNTAYFLFPVSGPPASIELLPRNPCYCPLLQNENRKHIAEAVTWNKRAGESGDGPASIWELRRKFKDSAKDEIWWGKCVLGRKCLGIGRAWEGKGWRQSHVWLCYERHWARPTWLRKTWQQSSSWRNDIYSAVLFQKGKPRTKWNEMRGGRSSG